MRRPIAALLILGSLSAAATIYAASSLSYAPLATPSDNATSVWYDPSQPAGQRDRNISLSTLKSIIATAGIDSSGLVPKTYTINSYPLTGPLVIGPADLAQTSSHRFTSDAEKTTWNAKQNALSNAATIGKITESGGAPLWDGAAWPGGSGLSSVTSSTPTTFSSGTILASSGSLLRAATKTDLGLGNVPDVDATSPANITQSASYRFTTDTEKATWNAKQNALAAGTDYATPAAVELKLNAANPTHTGAMTGPGYTSNAADGAHYVLPYNSVAFSGTPSIGMIQTTATGPQWYTGSAWASIGGGAVSSVAGRTGEVTLTAADVSGAEDVSNKSASTALGASNTLYPTQGAVKSYVDTAIAGVNAASGYVSVPTYSDQSCTAGQYAKGGGYVYFCGPGSAWDRVALAGWSNPSPVAPTLSSATIAANGTTLTLAMSASTSVGAGGSGGLDVDCPSITNDAATFVSGSGTSSLVYSLATAVLQSDSTNCNIDYTNPGNGLEGTTGGADVATIASASVTNNSTQTPAQASAYIGNVANTAGDVGTISGTEYGNLLVTGRVGGFTVPGTGSRNISKLELYGQSATSAASVFVVSDMSGNEVCTTEASPLTITNTLGWQGRTELTCAVTGGSAYQLSVLSSTSSGVVISYESTAGVSNSGYANNGTYYPTSLPSPLPAVTGLAMKFKVRAYVD